MELFHKFKNMDFACALEVLRVMAETGRMDIPTLRAIADDCNVTNPYDVIDCLQKTNLLEKGMSKWKAPEWLAAFPVAISPLEREALAYMLEHPLARLFFEEDTLEQLKLAAGKPKRLNHDFIECVFARMDAPLPDAAVFRTLLKAIQGGRRIAYQYCTRASRTLHTAHALPYAIEYNAHDGRWWLLLYHEEEDRSIKSILENIRAVTILETGAADAQAIETALNRKQAENRLVLRIRSQRNALERCFLLFGHYDRVESKSLDNGEYELSLYYFDFDAEDIIKNLMYLGPHITVVEPADLRKKLIERIAQAVSNLL